MGKVGAIAFASAMAGSSMGFAASQYENFYARCSLAGGLPEPSYEASSSAYTTICAAEHPNCEPSEALGVYYKGGNMVPVTLDKVDDDVELALKATEDRNFDFSNRISELGVLKRIGGRALEASVRELEPELAGGGSDLVMQLVRNYYPEAMPSSDVCRKVAEITIGQELLDKFAGEPVYVDGVATYPGKQILLQTYLNIVNFGRGTRGIEAASQIYFDKSADNLSLVEAATLVSIPHSPGRYEGSNDAERDAEQRANLLERRNNVLDNMYEAGVYDFETIAQAKQQPLDIEPYKVYRQGPSNNFDLSDEHGADNLGAMHFITDVKNQVMSTMGLSEDEFRNGLRINTTLSETVQRAVVRGVYGVDWPHDGRQVAVTMLGPDGNVVGEYGGNWEESEVNLALAEGPVGSSLKPYVYSEAMNSGFINSLNQTFTEENPFFWADFDTTGDEYAVDEGIVFPGGSGNGYDALAYSSNVIPLQLLRDQEAAGIPALENTANLMREFGMESESPAVPSMALGWWETSAFDLAEGMSGLVANQGLAKPTFSVNSVTKKQGEDYVQIDEGAFAPGEPHRVVSAENAADITEGLRGTVRYGTAANALGAIATDTAGKTGSVPGNAAAAFTGVSATNRGNLTTSVIMRRVDDLGDMGPGTTGGNIPARVYGAILNQLIDTNRRIN